MKPILLVPMAGKGQRFINKGYTTPKQFLDVGGHTMIEWSFKSFDWEDCDIVFIIRRDENYDVESHLKKIFGDDIKIVVTDELTDGTVCSCLLAKEYIDKDVPLGITTLDVFFKPKFLLNKMSDDIDGCLLTIETDNPGYSFSEVVDGYVVRTAEKKVISKYGNVGYYYFTKGSEFVKYAEKMIKNNIRTNGEFYVAPLYNLFIEDGAKITTIPIDKQYHMGTPEEMDYFKSQQMKDIIDEVW